MFTRIRWRIAIPYVILILLLMVVTGIYLSSLVRDYYLENLKSSLFTSVNILRESLQQDFSEINPDRDLDQIARTWSELLKARVTLISADGIVIGESHENRTRMDNHSQRPEIIQAATDGQGSSIRFSHTEGYDMLYVAIPVRAEDKIVGFIRLSLPIEQIQSYLRQLRLTIIIFTIIASMVAILLAMWIASRTTKPIRELTLAIDQIASGNLKRHIIPRTSDEVGRLTIAFNAMGDQLISQINLLELEREKLSSVLNEMSDGVLILDDYGKIQLLNPAAEQIFEVKAQDSLNRSLIEALRQHQLVELWQRCRETGEVQAILFENPTKNLYLQCVATSLGKTLPGYSLLLIQNLTRLRRLETIRQDFMSNISHELRTPLASLKALTETLQETALDDPPAAKRFLQRMETEVDSLSLIVSELLELSRIESGRVPLKMIPVSSMDIIIQAVDRLKLQAERAELTIQTDCPEEFPLVLADPTRLEQVLVNLLHNAIKFTPAGGRITVMCQLYQEKVCIAVQDTGIGIPANDLPRIFERFYKTDRARSSSGTGLGLAIARHLIEAHGGEIWAESIEGQGSTFYITIPITD